MCRHHACLGWLWSSWQVVCRSSRAGKLPAEVVLASPTLWLACAGKLQVKSILSTKWIQQIPSTIVLIRDVTDLDTSKDRGDSPHQVSELSLVVAAMLCGLSSERHLSVHVL